MVNIVLRSNTLDDQKEGKQSYSSLELLEEEVCFTQEKTKKQQPTVSFISKSKMADPLTSVYVLFEVKFWLLTKTWKVLTKLIGYY